jgi:hypothetical protein
MHKNPRVADMSDEVLARQAKARVEQSAEPFEEALRAVPKTEAGRQLGELRDAPTAMRERRPSGRRACPGSGPTSDTEKSETEQDEGGYSW